MKAIYEADLAKILAQLETANEAYEKALANMDVEEYRFNSGEGNQMAKQADINKLGREIERLEAARDRLIRKLEGRGIVNLNMRRKHYGRYY